MSGSVINAELHLAMNGQDKFALVPNRARALEYVGFGAGRVISGMVKDTLALANAAIQRRARPPRIVVMDDEPAVVLVLERLLPRKLAGATVVGFTDAKLAWQELIREVPDVFTTDINHVGPTTDEILRWLIANNAKYPIFVMSGSGIQSAKLQADFVGCGLNLTFIAKPFKNNELVRSISVHLGLSAHF